MLERWTKLFAPRLVQEPPPAPEAPAAPPPVPGAHMEGHRAEWDLWRTPTGTWIDVHRVNGTRRVTKNGRVSVYDAEGRAVSPASTRASLPRRAAAR